MSYFKAKMVKNRFLPAYAVAGELTALPQTS